MEIKNQNIAWLNFANPGEKELEFLNTELKIDPSVVKQLLKPNKRPKIEEYDDYLFSVMHFPVFDSQNRQTLPTELDFIIADGRLITIYQDPNPALESFFKDCEKDAALRNLYFKNTGFLLFSILDKLVDSCLPMLDHIHEKIEEIEKQVFSGKESRMLKEIAIVKRDIIDFRRTIKPQRSVLEVLARKDQRFFKENLEMISQEVIGSEIRVWNVLENHKEMIEAIEKTNESLLSFQISRVMHTLTYFSILLFTLTFITSFFSMKAISPVHFGGILLPAGIMLLAILIISAVFKWKKWI